MVGLSYSAVYPYFVRSAKHSVTWRDDTVVAPVRYSLVLESATLGYEFVLVVYFVAPHTSVAESVYLRLIKRTVDFFLLTVRLSRCKTIHMSLLFYQVSV